MFVVLVPFFNTNIASVYNLAICVTCPNTNVCMQQGASRSPAERSEVQDSNRTNGKQLVLEFHGARRGSKWSTHREHLDRRTPCPRRSSATAAHHILELEAPHPSPKNEGNADEEDEAANEENESACAAAQWSGALTITTNSTSTTTTSHSRHEAAAHHSAVDVPCVSSAP